MFRNNYDNDSVTFSPQGRIFQVEYAGEAVKQGSVVVGIVSKTHAVVAALMRNAEELSSYQKKIIEIAPHCGIGFAGLTADARVLSRFMQQESLREQLWFNRPILVSRLIGMIGDRAQRNTQLYGRRPYGVGLLIAGYDRTGPHLFEFQPSGVVQEMLACGIGARSQMSRTYLERNLESFESASRDDLITHAIRALKDSLGQDKELTIDNTTIGVIGKEENFKLIQGQSIAQYLNASKDFSSTSGSAGARQSTSQAVEQPADSMEVDS